MRTLALTDESLAWSELYAPLAPGTPDEMYQMQVVCYVYFATLTVRIRARQANIAYYVLRRMHGTGSYH